MAKNLSTAKSQVLINYHKICGFNYGYVEWEIFIKYLGTYFLNDLKLQCNC